MQAGMDVARLNMDYFEPNEMVKVIEQIQAASDELGTSCLIFSLLLFRLSKVFATV